MRRLAIALLASLAVMGLLATPASAQDDSPEAPGTVDVLQVSGLVDDILVDAIDGAIPGSAPVYVIQPML